MPPLATIHPDVVHGAFGWVAAVLYVLGLGTLIVRRGRARSGPSLVDHLPTTVGFIAHVVSFTMLARSIGRFPVGNMRESASFLALLLAAAYLLAAARFRYAGVQAMLLALVIAFLGLGLVLPGGAYTETTFLNNRWFVFHTALSFLGLTALFAGCVLSVLYLWTDSQLKNKRPGALLRFFPSLVACDSTALRLLILGFPLLTLGIVAGVMWLREAGPRTWGPKELWAFTAWFMYALLLFVRLARGWRGRRAAILSVAAAVVALGAFFSIRL